MRRIRFSAIIPINLTQIRRCSEQAVNSQPTERNLLEEFALGLVNHDFVLATKKLDHLKAMYQPDQAQLQHWQLDVTNGIPAWIEYGSLRFPTFLSHDKTTAITEAACQIDELLSQPSKCIPLLSQLDSILRESKKKLPHVLPGKGFFVTDKLQVPSTPTQEFDTKKFDYALPDVIRDKLIQHHLGREMAFFSGFIEHKTANDIIKKGGLFCELPYEGNTILHGLYAHLIQWYILVTAFEKKLLRFDSNLTLSDFLAATVDVTYEDRNTTLWTGLFDHAANYAGSTPITRVKRHFGKPHRLNTTLLFCNSLPTLQSWLLTYGWYGPIAEVQRMYTDTYSTKQAVKDRPSVIPYEVLVAAQAMNHVQVNSIDLGFSKNRIARRLLDNGSQLILDENTGLACHVEPPKKRKLNMRLRFWKSEEEKDMSDKTVLSQKKSSRLL